MKMILKETYIKNLIKEHVQTFVDVKKFELPQVRLFINENGETEAEIEMYEVVGVSRK